MNSLSHAYSEKEVGQILICVSQEGEKVRLIYQDDGKGMSPDVVLNVFEPFFTTRRGSGGSGLGMHILFNLVTQTLGGEVNCHSKVGKGTTFDMLFPLKIL